MSVSASAAGTSLAAQRPAAHRRGHLGGSRRAAAGHRQPPDAGLAQQPGRELARAAGAEHDRMAGGEPAQVRGGEVEAGPGQRDALGADRGLRAGPLAGPQRRVDQAGEGSAGGSRRGGRAGRGLDLGDDLVLTDGHRVQPARDREQVLGGRAADPDPGHPQDVAGLGPPTSGQEVRDRPGRLSGPALTRPRRPRPGGRWTGRPPRRCPARRAAGPARRPVLRPGRRASRAPRPEQSGRTRRRSQSSSR